MNTYDDRKKTAEDTETDDENYSLKAIKPPATHLLEMLPEDSKTVNPDPSIDSVGHDMDYGRYDDGTDSSEKDEGL